MYLKQKQNNTTRTWKNIKPYNKQGRLQHTPVQVSGTGVGSNMYTTLLQVFAAELYAKNSLSNSPDN